MAVEKDKDLIIIDPECKLFFFKCEKFDYISKVPTVVVLGLECLTSF